MISSFLIRDRAWTPALGGWGLSHCDHQWSPWNCLSTSGLWGEKSCQQSETELGKMRAVSVLFSMHGFLASVSQVSHSVMSNSATPGTVACQASLSITNSRSLLKLMSIVLVMPSNHLILCCPLLLPPSIFPSIESFKWVSFCVRWPKYWSFSFHIRY